MKVVGEVECNHDPRGGGVDTHVVSGVVKELCPGIALNVVRVIVTPAKLNINPILLSGSGIHHISEGRGGGREGVITSTS